MGILVLGQPALHGDIKKGNMPRYKDVLWNYEEKGET